MMNLLLKFEGYPPAILFAVLLHGSLLWFFLDRELGPDSMVKIEPTYISVATVQQNPQRLRRIEQLELMRAEEQRKAREKENRDRAAREKAAREKEAAAKAEAERKRQAEADAKKRADQQRREAERLAEEKRQAEARKLAEAEQRRRQLEEQRQREAEAQARQAQAQARAEAQQAENSLVGQYTAIIKDLISQNWILSADARNGMTAVVEIRTTPVGDIISTDLVQRSGSAAFDQSVLQAVARVGDFQELRDLPTDIYERNFRIFHLEFRPEDLLR